MSRHLWRALCALMAGSAGAQLKVETDNPWVRVARAKAGPRGKIPMHEHPASVPVCLIEPK